MKKVEIEQNIILWISIWSIFSKN